MTTRTRIIQRFTRAQCTFSAAYQQSFSSPAATSSRRRGIGLGTTIKYPRRTTGAAAGRSLGTTLDYLHGAAGNGRAQR
jgi:hypothetical protein